MAPDALENEPLMQRVTCPKTFAGPCAGHERVMTKKLSKTEDTEERKSQLTSHVAGGGLPWEGGHPQTLFGLHAGRQQGFP